MKKFLVILLSLALAVTALGLAACTPTEDPETPAIDIAGEYAIDLSEAGMPMTVYLQVEDDGAFAFAADDSFSSVKSAGTISTLSTGYLMMFSEVNGEAVDTGTQTCNLTKEADGSLVFDGTIPYGSATFSSPMTNDDGEEVIISAVPVGSGDVSGDNENTIEPGIYYGTHTTDGMMATTYEYYLTIREDGKFTSFVTFTAMGSACMSYDYGTYSASGSMCRMTSTVYDDPETEDDLTEALTVDADGVYTADVKMSRMASDTVTIEVEKLSASPDEVVASYEGTHSIAMGPMTMDFDCTLDVYADGSYSFTATSSDGDANTETGFIGIENMMSLSGILLPDGMTSPADISLTEEGALTGQFSMGAGSRQEVTLTPVAA